MSTKTLVLAGNVEQFKAYCEKLGKKPGVDLTYIASGEQLAGLYDFEVIRIGTWETHPAADAAAHREGIAAKRLATREEEQKKKNADREAKFQKRLDKEAKQRLAAMQPKKRKKAKKARRK